MARRRKGQAFAKESQPLSEEKPKPFRKIVLFSSDFYYNFAGK